MANLEASRIPRPKLREIPKAFLTTNRDSMHSSISSSIHGRGMHPSSSVPSSHVSNYSQTTLLRINQTLSGSGSFFTSAIAYCILFLDVLLDRHCEANQSRICLSKLDVMRVTPGILRQNWPLGEEIQESPSNLAVRGRNPGISDKTGHEPMKYRMIRQKCL